MNVRYRIELSQAKCGELTTMLSGGKHAARKLKRAQKALSREPSRRPTSAQSGFLTRD